MRARRAVLDGLGMGAPAFPDDPPGTAAPAEESSVILLRVTGSSGAPAAPAESPLTVVVDRDRGTSLTAGRYTLKIPPRALPISCAITLRACEEDGTVGCDALPLGLDLEVPAVLSIALKGTDAGASDRCTVCAWDPVTGGWEELGGRVDPQTGVLLALATRLSRFAVKGGSG